LLKAIEILELAVLGAAEDGEEQEEKARGDGSGACAHAGSGRERRRRLISKAAGLGKTDLDPP
jgi:hypothetical protein